MLLRNFRILIGPSFCEYLKFKDKDKYFQLTFKGQLISKANYQAMNSSKKMGGRHLVDIIDDISWTKGVTSRGHFWRHLVDKNVHEMSSI